MTQTGTCSDSEDINVFVEAVVSFVGKLVHDTVPKITVRTFPHQKPWVDKTICDALNSRTTAYNAGLSSGSMEEYKAACYRVRRAVKEAKQRYRRKLESQFQQSGSRALWQGLRRITGFKIPPSGIVSMDVSSEQTEHLLRSLQGCSQHH